MKYHFKSFVSKRPFLYTLWYYLIRKHRGVKVEFFKDKTALYIDGFPRSGNTFLTHLCKDLFPNMHFVHHLHVIAPIKIALRKKIPVFILFRSPLEAISSRYLFGLMMKNTNYDGNIDEVKLIGFINHYISYYEYVLNKKNELTLLNFQSLINEPEIVLKAISHKIEGQFHVDEKKVKMSVKTYLNNKRSKKTILGGGITSETREKYKSEIKKRITSHKEYQRLIEIENKLRSSKNV